VSYVEPGTGAFFIALGIVVIDEYQCGAAMSDHTMDLFGDDLTEVWPTYD
jgi:hypothetical protein